VCCVIVCAIVAPCAYRVSGLLSLLIQHYTRPSCSHVSSLFFSEHCKPEFAVLSRSERPPQSTRRTHLLQRLSC
jgi:hypothetical protein